MTQEDEFWRRVRAKVNDPTFVYAVQTTGVYCRSGCASRLPRRENVYFYASAADAEAAGYRECKRCRPDQDSWLAQACGALEADPNLSLAQLADHVGLSRFHLQRRFKARIGMTPKQYAQGVRRGLLGVELRRGRGVTEALHAAGYSSPSQTCGALGMTASEYKSGAPNRSIAYAQRPCALGELLVAWTERGVCAVELGFPGHDLLASLRARFPAATLLAADAAVLVDAVVAAVEGKPGEQLPLDLQGTTFQRRVWHELQSIAHGSTLTYSELAHRLGSPAAARAVAAACAANPLAVLVPCHRVVGKDGALRGYRWGLELKRALLQREMHPNA
jgi:AraC family transcriptional regulator, regulatory protein of adaptative response / methylated-DNA-[protein]-cysteine methyltransferase